MPPKNIWVGTCHPPAIQVAPTPLIANSVNKADNGLFIRALGVEKKAQIKLELK